MKYITHIAVLLPILFILTGCATSYHEKDWLGRGYSEMALAKDTYLISFSGNGFTSEGSVQSNLLRRCADLTISKGYRYFVITRGKTSVDTAIMQTPTTINVNSYGNYQDFGYGTTNYSGNHAYSNYSMMGSGYTNSHATINPGTQYQINKYTSRVVVKMFNKKTSQTLDAKVILSNF